jgi:hypothetical protein
MLKPELIISKEKKCKTHTHTHQSSNRPSTVLITTRMKYVKLNSHQWVDRWVHQGTV